MNIDQKEIINLTIIYFPIAAIGIWRWSIWLMKKSIGLFYQPEKAGYTDTVSIITPIYNESPEVLETAFKSWVAENPDEIIAVIDYSDKSSIAFVQNFKKKFENLTIIITEKPGKREALADGIKIAKSNIIALVDCDTIWTENTLRNALAPFKDKQVGGVATRQNVIQTNSTAKAIFDMQLDLRYFDEMPFLSAAGDALTCLSGRTAFYRAAAIKHQTENLINEYFLGKKAISGDDKRLTFLIQAEGWKTAYQHNAVVLTFGAEKISTFLKQRIRWGRNSWRANLSALKHGWVWKHRALSFFILDQFIQPLTLLLGMFYMIFSIVYQQWTSAIILFAWWFISRAVKLWPHLRRKPKNIIYLPAYIALSFPLAALKIYSFFTITTHSWVTRWDKNRLANFSFLDKSFKTALTAVFIVGIGSISYLDFNNHILSVNRQELLVNGIKYNSDLKSSNIEIENLASQIDKGPLFVKYTVKEGDTLLSISQRYNISTEELLELNVNHLPNWNLIEIGDVLTIPTREVPAELNTTVNYRRRTLPILTTTFDSTTNTLTVKGRGNKLTLKELAEKTQYKYIKEVEAGIWYATSSIYIGNGVSLTIDGKEVKWLRLASNEKYHVKLHGYGANIYINDTKITSWDEAKNDYDYNYDDKRAFVILQNTGRMDIYNSELAYLGYKSPELTVGGSYGVSWRVSTGTFGKNLITGEIINSEFHNNYFGVYTFGATGMVFQGNTFRDNAVYGLDPHDDSNNFIVEDNIAYNNKNHGIIFSKRCFNNIIRGNISYNNGLHGIMLHEKSNNNLVENNTVYGNTDGIAIYDSSSNLIIKNKIYDNEKGIRINKNSSSNVSYENEINNSKLYGIYIYDNSQNNIVRKNLIANAKSGVYIKQSDLNEISENELSNTQTALKLANGSNQNKFIENKLFGTHKYSMYSPDKDFVNFLGPNGLGEDTKSKITANNN
jgi:hyaluronan synthase